MEVMMGCGHAANGVSDGKPVCAICIGIYSGATDVVPCPDLTGRRAKCSHCSCTLPSKATMPFFEARPLMPTDGFYCGCLGWD
jgi:hypothetical protein